MPFRRLVLKMLKESRHPYGLGVMLRVRGGVEDIVDDFVKRFLHKW